MMDFGYTIAILLLPLFSFLVIGLTGCFRGAKGWPARLAGFIGTGSLGMVTLLCYATALQYFGAERLADGTFATHIPYNVMWLPLGRLHFDLGILLDPISVLMLVVISTVSLMVHIYSFGYMKGEKGFQRYYAFLSLFTFSMLGLVVATNVFQMYLFWELVGVSSYLLIGFYYTSPAAIHASKKAFIVTRFADMFFLVGILIYGYYTGTFNFSFSEVVHGPILPVALLLMFIGGAGKSAMFPLHIWLPDAMEGPTPVSALIHAATMVVAGVFQIARLFPLWMAYASEWMWIIVVVGAFTALFAAIVACVLTDIKRVLAFSTISQIAFMMVALGVCRPGHEAIVDNHASLGYLAAMFHLFTHAMFKACLFLGAGCIIHAVHSNEMSKMGGLRRYMPVTHATFLISCMAIAGIPFFSGFCSKDEILTACFAYSPLCGGWMTAVAALTAFYMFRLYYGIFWGTEDKTGHAHHRPHEAPWSMTLPLVLLSLITVGVGITGTLGGFFHWSWASFGQLVSTSGQPYTIHFDTSIALTSTLIAICAIALATYLYKGERQPMAERLRAMAPRLHQWAYHRFYIDEAYQFITHRVLFRCVSRPAAWIDEHIINALLDFTAWETNKCGEKLRQLQDGDVRNYAVWFITGATALALLLMCL